MQVKLILHIENIDDGTKEVSSDNVSYQGGHTNIDGAITEILRLIKANPQITRKALSNSIGIAASAILKHINRLKADDVIRRVGGDYGGHWEILRYYYHPYQCLSMPIDSYQINDSYL
jgi:Predicted transcriptional regulator containing an HTH domain and an uncharacterized domain shared with the mammalian protein Schlafen